MLARSRCSMKMSQNVRALVLVELLFNSSSCYQKAHLLKIRGWFAIWSCIPGLVSSNVALDDDGFLFEESEVPPAEEPPDVPLDSDGGPSLSAVPFFLQLLVEKLLEEHLTAKHAVMQSHQQHVTSLTRSSFIWTKTRRNYRSSLWSFSSRKLKLSQGYGGILVQSSLQRSDNILDLKDSHTSACVIFYCVIWGHFNGIWFLCLSVVQELLRFRTSEHGAVSEDLSWSLITQQRLEKA